MTFDSPHYRVAKRLVRLLGLWPYQKLSTQVIIIIIIFCDTTSVAVPMVRYFTDKFSNTTEVINCLPALCVTYIAYVALVFGIFNFDKFKSTLDIMKWSWDNLQDSEEKIIFQKYSKISRSQSTAIIGISTTAIIAYARLPSIAMGVNHVLAPNESRSVDNILKVNFYNLDPQEYFVPIYLHSFVAVFLLVYLSEIYSVYFVVVINHACAMFAVLGRRIENVDRQNKKLLGVVSDYRLDKALCNIMKRCINHHSECLRFSRLINDSLTYFWLIVLFVNGLMITVTAVQTIVNFGKPFLMINAAMNTTSITIRLMFITRGSEQLFDHSDQVQDTIYKIDWYELPTRSKKLVLVVLLTNPGPCKITAGRMVDLNLETFCRFMEMSTYFICIYGPARSTLH